MKVLVLCVDRDDDFGEKAGINSPIIGRQDNLRAAISLGLSDPEDSDVNALFAALKAYDELVEEEDVKIATICGDKNVGQRSDRALATQLENVLSDVKPDSVTFVTDGAEDEFILPIITSRTHIDHVERVIVRQQKDLEGTYYIIMKALKEEKIRQRIYVPLGLILMAYFVPNFLLFLSGSTRDVGWLFVGLILGIYFLLLAFHMEGPIISAMNDMRVAMKTRRYFTTFSVLGAAALSLYAISRGYDEVIVASNVIVQENIGDFQLFLIYTLHFIEGSIWYIVIGLLLYTIGKTIDLYIIKGRFYTSSLTVTFSLFTTYLIAMAVIRILLFLFDPTESELKVTEIILYSLVGFFFGFFAITFYGYFKTHADETMVSGGSGWQR